MNNIIFMWDPTGHWLCSPYENSPKMSKLTKFYKTQNMPKRVSYCSVSTTTKNKLTLTRSNTNLAALTDKTKKTAM